MQRRQHESERKVGTKKKGGGAESREGQPFTKVEEGSSEWTKGWKGMIVPRMCAD